MNERLSREEIALRLLCAHVQAGRPVGPANVKESFALAMTFEDHSDTVGGRPYRGRPDRDRRIGSPEED